MWTCCLLALLAVAADESPFREGILREEFIYTEAPFPRCHASTLAETPAGLVAAWFGGPNEKHPTVAIWLSRQVKGEWTPVVKVADGVQYTTPQGKDHRHACWNPVLYQVPNGPLMLFYKVGPNPRSWWGMLTISKDHGQTWSEPRRLPEGIDGPVKNKPILLADGTLLCGSSTENAGWRLHMEMTKDQGKTWQRTQALNDGKTFAAIQPTLLSHADGSLQLLCRTRQGKVATSISKDQGKTWSPLTATDLPNPSSGIDAVTLADGRHLLVYNHQRRGRGQLQVAISPDGKAWNAALQLENTLGAEFSYPAVIQTADGGVHITYTWKRRRIKHVVVDPAKLELRPITEGMWPSAGG